MVRRYEEPIEVRAGVGGAGAGLLGADVDLAGGSGSARDSTPSAFLWRGRLYIVREVIGHWRERRAWWRGALDPDEEVASRGLDCLEQEVWRVEASPGRLAGTGVYDLGRNDLGNNRDLSRDEDRGRDGMGGRDGTDGPGHCWRLLRVAD